MSAQRDRAPIMPGHLLAPAQEVTDAVRAGMRGFQVRSVVLLGEGADNLAYEVNGEVRRA